jgi:hypothetical protein
MPYKLPEMKKLEVSQVAGATLEAFDDHPERSRVLVQCNLRTGELYELAIPFSDAMRLLAYLRDMEGLQPPQRS